MSVFTGMMCTVQTACTHSDARDSLALDLLSTIVECTQQTLPTYGGCMVGETLRSDHMDIIH